MILLELHRGGFKERRYSEVKRNLPDITSKILSLRLKELESEGLIKKKIDANEFPVSSFYSLTASGKDFINVIKQIKEWALRWKMKNKTCSMHDCSECPASHL